MVGRYCDIILSNRRIGTIDDDFLLLKLHSCVIKAVSVEDVFLCLSLFM